jgi:hypothetical protein
LNPSEDFGGAAAATLTAGPEPVPKPSPVNESDAIVPFPIINTGGPSLNPVGAKGRIDPPRAASTVTVRTGIAAELVLVCTTCGFGCTLTTDLLSETLVILGVNMLLGSVAGQISGPTRNAISSAACTPTETAKIDPLRDNPRPPETADVTRLCSNIAAPRLTKCARSQRGVRTPI